MSIGEKVWVYKPSRVGGYRLEPRWWGPAIITKRVGQYSYEVTWDEQVETQLVHLDDLKLYEEPPFFDEEGYEEDPEDLIYNAQPREEPSPPKIDKILAHRFDKNNKLELLVKWPDKGLVDATWQPAEQFAVNYPSQWVEYFLAHKDIPTSWPPPDF